MTNKFTGTGVALVTPFKNGEVDFDGLSNVIEHTIKGGLDFLVSLGTTGETATLSQAEKYKILEFTVAKVKGRVPIVAGFGGNNTAKVRQALKDFHFEGISGILSASPAYNKPTQEGIFQHYMSIAEVAPRPIIVYNVPGRTASNITAETTLRLAQEEPFVAVKEASGNLEQVMQIAKNKPTDFTLLSGDDNLTLPIMSFGAQGVISVVANALPSEFSRMVKLASAGNFKEAAEIHLSLIDLVNLLFVDGNPAGVKGLLCHLGLCQKDVRLPLTSITAGTFDLLIKQHDSLKVMA